MEIKKVNEEYVIKINGNAYYVTIGNMIDIQYKVDGRYETAVYKREDFEEYIKVINEIKNLIK